MLWAVFFHWRRMALIHRASAVPLPPKGEGKGKERQAQPLPQRGDGKGKGAAGAAPSPEGKARNGDLLGRNRERPVLLVIEVGEAVEDEELALIDAGVADLHVLLDDLLLTELV